MAPRKSTMQAPPRRRLKGSALLELALVMPFLCLLLLGVFDLGRVYSEQVTVTAAARDGARAATYLSDDTVVRGIVVSAINNVVTITPTTDITITSDLITTQTVRIS